MAELPARERIILAVDTSSEAAADRLARTASEAGARFVKLGLQLSSATSWRQCSELAAKHGLDWVADAKLDDIPNTVAETVKNIASLEHPPFGITMHTTAGQEAMRVAQEQAGKIKMLGVTVLTSIPPEEATELFGQDINVEDIVTIYNKLLENSPNLQLASSDELGFDEELKSILDTYMQSKAAEQVGEIVLKLATKAAVSGVKGVVASPLEVGLIKRNPDTKNMFAMIPGTRSLSADAQDQVRIGTPTQAIIDRADLLVIGRQITQAEDPAQAYENLVLEIERAA
ncbi:MAG TPA: orotidine 5'-phosphate decarboxylase / HUMPS family protein [Candidatus Saccharimonadales bacterium]|nr:orotidine 5'-phosphate decarboxylase / HUMPS family protein [Candidatus Saccharimonadales bacterium]